MGHEVQSSRKRKIEKIVLCKFLLNLTVRTVAIHNNKNGDDYSKYLENQTKDH